MGGKRRLLGLGERRKECVRGKLVVALVAGGKEEDAMFRWLSEKSESETVCKEQRAESREDERKGNKE